MTPEQNATATIGRDMSRKLLVGSLVLNLAQVCCFGVLGIGWGIEEVDLERK